MKFISTLISVADMEISKQFYHNVLGLNVIDNFGANVTLDGGISLQTLDTWKSFIRSDKIILPNNASELYFEEDNMDAFCNHLKSFEISYVHELFEHRWGQRVVLFYDPDKHIIEVGEKMDAVILRFMNQGLSVEDIAFRMDVPVDYVNVCLNDHKYSNI